MPKARGGKGRKVKPVMHIFCEGEKTEPNYLNAYLANKYSANRLLRVIKIEKTNKNTPIQLVEAAVALKSSQDTTKLDEFWVVYDRESKAKYSDALHQQALDKAKPKKIHVAISNVCFELWILLHFREVSAPFTSFTNLMKESQIKSDLRKIGISSYDKADCQLFEKIYPLIPTARARAERMNIATIRSSQNNESQPHRLNPYTTIQKLLDAIDKFAEKHIG